MQRVAQAVNHHIFSVLLLHIEYDSQKISPIVFQSSVQSQVDFSDKFDFSAIPSFNIPKTIFEESKHSHKIVNHLIHDPKQYMEIKYLYTFEPMNSWTISGFRKLAVIIQNLCV